MVLAKYCAILCAAMVTIMAAFSLSGPVRAAEQGTDDLLVRLSAGSGGGATLAALQLQGEVEPLAPEIGIYRLRSITGAVTPLLQSDPGVLYVEPNHPTRISQAPDDLYYASVQWALPGIHAPAAWDIVTGSNPITIAIIDTGIDFLHEDLWQKIVPGATFISGTTTAQDDHGHGTHVAGIAAASTNNAIGVAGVSWGARLMPVKVLSAGGGGTYAELISGIRYAAAHGAQILNMSLDGDVYSQALQDTIDWAYGQGALLVASAGNCALGGQGCEGVNPVMYPAGNNHVVSVAATDEQNLRAAFSTFNGWVDLAAPGIGIYSTHWQFGAPNAYLWMSGTSQAAPHVSGLAALVWSERPALRNSDIEVILKNTARDVNSAQYPGQDQYLGWGLIDAARAVDRTPPESHVESLSRAQSSLSFTVSWSGADDNAGLRSYTIQVRDGAGPWQNWQVDVTVTAATFTGIEGHTYYFQSSATDWAGNTEAYPGGDGDTHIALLPCALSGQVRDNRAVSVAGAVVSIAPGGESVISDDGGRYAVTPATCGASLSVTAQRAGFAPLAPMHGLAFGDGITLTGLTLYLPPVDNLIAAPAWQFEGGALAPAWARFGATLPGIAPGKGHTGDYAAFVGTPMTTTSPAGESGIAVTVTIPLSMYRPTLSFMYRILTLDNAQHDDFEVFVNGEAVFRDAYHGTDYGTVVHDLGWRHGWVDLSAWSGRQVGVRLSVVQGFAYAGYPTGAYIDEVSIGSASGGPHAVVLPVIISGE